MTEKIHLRVLTVAQLQESVLQAGVSATQLGQPTKREVADSERQEKSQGTIKTRRSSTKQLQRKKTTKHTKTDAPVLGHKLLWVPLVQHLPAAHETNAVSLPGLLYVVRCLKTTTNEAQATQRCRAYNNNGVALRSQPNQMLPNPNSTTNYTRTLTCTHTSP